MCELCLNDDAVILRWVTINNYASWNTTISNINMESLNESFDSDGVLSSMATAQEIRTTLPCTCAAVKSLLQFIELSLIATSAKLHFGISVLICRLKCTKICEHEYNV